MNYRQSSYKQFCYNYSGFAYTREAVRQLDKMMIEQQVVGNGYQLMSTAAQQLLDFINQHYPQLQSLTLFCGAGNNAGDGYVLARLAKAQEITVKVRSIIDPHQLKGDAFNAYQDWIDCGGEVRPLFSGQSKSIDQADFDSADLIVDALIGTGLERPLNDEWYTAVALINKCQQPILAVDIPTGLDANTGSVHGIAIKAKHTVTFIAKKQGMYTGQARNYCGEIHFSPLGVPDELYQQVNYSAVLANWSWLKKGLFKRKPADHKGNQGHLLIIGGDYGMAGACRIAGEAALRAGAGLVSIATRSANVANVSCGRPELMVHGVEDPDELMPLVAKATAIVIGPGLGSGEWGQSLLAQVLTTKHHKLLDADALNIIAHDQQHPLVDNIIYTPHPGEAARLLATDVSTIENDRFDAINQLKRLYGGCFVLKGAGSLVRDNDDLSICPYGNEGMASGGMGDSLSGVIGALLVQGFKLSDAAELGVNLHAKAGDMTAKEGKKGLLASDLLPAIRYLVNTNSEK